LKLSLPLIVEITVGVISDTSVKAQQQQTFRECIDDLYRYFSASESANRCEQALKIQPPIQTIGQCTSDLYKYFSAAEASNRCQTLLTTQNQNQNSRNQFPTPVLTPVPAPVPTPVVVPGGSPEAIASCMRRLMYERKLFCTRSRCSSIPSEGFGGWQTQNVRTEISEAAAVQACQNAR
jgi:hypothetical protein